MPTTNCSDSPLLTDKRVKRTWHPTSHRLADISSILQPSGLASIAVSLRPTNSSKAHSVWNTVTRESRVLLPAPRSADIPVGETLVLDGFTSSSISLAQPSSIGTLEFQRSPRSNLFFSALDIIQLSLAIYCFGLISFYTLLTMHVSFHEPCCQLI